MNDQGERRAASQSRQGELPLDSVVRAVRPLLRAVVTVLLAAGVAWFLGGLILFPDAPIQRCNAGYCGKQHQARTQRDFEHFTIWEDGLKLGWPLVLVAAWWLQKDRKRDKSTT